MRAKSSIIFWRSWRRSGTRRQWEHGNETHLSSAGVPSCEHMEGVALLPENQLLSSIGIYSICWFLFLNPQTLHGICWNVMHMTSRYFKFHKKDHNFMYLWLILKKEKRLFLLLPISGVNPMNLSWHSQFPLEMYVLCIRDSMWLL